MKKFLLALVLVLPMVLVGCGEKNPIAGTTWLGENQYYYDVITFSEDSLTYTGVDVQGNVVVPDIKIPYNWKENNIGAFYSYLDTVIIDRPIAFDSIRSLNFISGFNADDVKNGRGTLRVWRHWSSDGKKWEREDVAFESINFYKSLQNAPTSESSTEIIKNIKYHGLLPIFRDRHYVRENDYGAKSQQDYYLMQHYLQNGLKDSLALLVADNKVVQFDGKWFVRGASATADYVLVTKERGGDKFYVDWNTFVNYSDNYSVSYHNAITGKSQSSYGGSREQLRDLEAADASLTEYEKSIEAEYERQVERELREMERW